eukprot:SAG31_NODE_3231_length_4514_cov_4.860249_2_plen_296_part_00
MTVCCRAPSHGEGEHNTAAESYGEWAYYAERWRDAPLTAVGKGQAVAVGRAVAQELGSAAVELICTSPLTRTLQTAKHIAAQLQKLPPIMTLDAVRERLDGAQPANSRRARSKLQVQYPDVDFSTVADEEDTAFEWVQRLVRDTVAGCAEQSDEEALHTLANYGFSRALSEQALVAVTDEVSDGLKRTALAVQWLKEEANVGPLFTEWTPYEDDAATSTRVAAFLGWLSRRPESEILVSTHCMFLHTLFGRSPSMRKAIECEPRVDASYFARGERRVVQILFERTDGCSVSTHRL